MKRPFYAFRLNDGHDERYCNLLESLNLSFLIKDKNSIIDKIPTWDFNVIEFPLMNLRNASLNYIKEIIN